jgi:hypothetical protein
MAIVEIDELSGLEITEEESGGTSVIKFVEWIGDVLKDGSGLGAATLVLTVAPCGEEVAIALPLLDVAPGV